MKEIKSENEISEMINDLDKDDTVKLMKWLISESKKNELDKKTKPNKSTSTDDMVMRNRLRM